MNSTRAAKSSAAPELGPFQSEKIPQRPEQRHLGICSLEITLLPIHIELHFRPLIKGQYDTMAAQFLE